MTVTAYPLQWPSGWRRTDSAFRVASRFHRVANKRSDTGWSLHRDLTVAEAIARVRTELSRMDIDPEDVVISTNLTLRLDGLPRSDQRAPADPGAAVYWVQRDGGRRVMAIDQYRLVQDNIAAIAATLDAMRAIERHGGAAVLERAFTGFAALPAPPVARPWWEVLGVSQTATGQQIVDAYRRLVGTHHPDRGGDSDTMAEINKARDEGLAARRL